MISKRRWTAARSSVSPRVLILVLAMTSSAFGPIVALLLVGACGSRDKLAPVEEASAALVAGSGSAGTRSGPTSPTPDLPSWRAAIAKAPFRANRTISGTGCFEASFPDNSWKEVACLPAPREHFAGNGVDGDALLAPSSADNISMALGTFPSVLGVTSESDTYANSFSLQLNTNYLSNLVISALCAGGTTPGNCRGWQQFIYSNKGGGLGVCGASSSCGFIEIWLLGYGATTSNPCPTSGCPSSTSNWTQSGTDCVCNSDAAGIADESIGNLGNLSLMGTVASGSDAVIFYDGSSAISVAIPDSTFYLASNWKWVEFNVFGNGSSRPIATFYPLNNVAIRVNIALVMASGNTGSPLCTTAGSGSSAESNNLPLVANSCCPHGLSKLGIDFLESNASGVNAPFCLLNQIAPLLF